MMNDEVEGSQFALFYFLVGVSDDDDASHHWYPWAG